MGDIFDIWHRGLGGGISCIGVAPINGPKYAARFDKHAGQDHRWIGLSGKRMTDPESLPLRGESTGKMRYVSFAAVSTSDDDHPGWSD